jgi:hypothetical protein
VRQKERIPAGDLERDDNDYYDDDDDDDDDEGD